MLPAGVVILDIGSDTQTMEQLGQDKDRKINTQGDFQLGSSFQMDRVWKYCEVSLSD